jgi:hypothetical protein
MLSAVLKSKTAIEAWISREDNGLYKFTIGY